MMKREKGVTDNQYYKAMKTTNGRMISIGDDLWREKKKLRAIEEKKGLAPELGTGQLRSFCDHTATFLQRFVEIESAIIQETESNEK